MYLNKKNLKQNLGARPLITFALFTYNHEKFISEAVNGALAQTYEPLEIIISDDCSSDRTFEIITEIVENYQGPHILRIKQNSVNLGRERFGLRISSVLEMCNGELIVIASGDDISIPERTAIIFENWKKLNFPKISLHSLVQPIDEDGNPLGAVVGNNYIAERPLSELILADGKGLLGASHAISREIYDRFGPLSDNILIEDGALAFRARLLDGIEFIPYCLVKYRRHSNNMSFDREVRSYADFKKYLSSLIGQHSGFLSDYSIMSNNSEMNVLKSFSKIFKRINRLQYLYEGNLLQKIIAFVEYLRGKSLKRKVILFSCFIRLTKRKNISFIV